MTLEVQVERAVAATVERAGNTGRVVLGERRVVEQADVRVVVGQLVDRELAFGTWHRREAELVVRAAEVAGLVEQQLEVGRARARVGAGRRTHDRPRDVYGANV